MGIITSKIKPFYGTVALPDVLTLTQVLSIEKLIDEISGNKKTYLRAELDGIILDVVLPLFSDWHINGLPEHPTVETFPGTPRKASALLISWLLDNVMEVYKGETEIPNN